MLDQTGLGRQSNEMAAQSIASAAHHDDQSAAKGRIVGASLLGAARHLKRRAWIPRYMWTMDSSDVIDILCGFGPVLLGLPWFEPMYDPDHLGIVKVNGTGVGRHAIVADEFIPGLDALKRGLGHSDLVGFVPSLGRAYGIAGRGYLRIMDLTFLMLNGGEGVVPTNMQASEQTSGASAFMSRPIVRRLTSPFRRD